MPEGIQIFLMEDDADDIELLEGSLKDNKVRYRMDVVMEGDKVQDYIMNCKFFPIIGFVFAKQFKITSFGWHLILSKINQWISH